MIEYNNKTQTIAAVESLDAEYYIKRKLGEREIEWMLARLREQHEELRRLEDAPAPDCDDCEYKYP